MVTSIALKAIDYKCFPGREKGLVNSLCSSDSPWGLNGSCRWWVGAQQVNYEINGAIQVLAQLCKLIKTFLSTWMDSKEDPIVCHKNDSCSVFLFHFFAHSLNVLIIPILHVVLDYLLLRTGKVHHVGHYINDISFLHHLIVVFRIRLLHLLNPCQCHLMQEVREQ